MKKRVLTCIICPRGCTLEVSLDADGGVEGVAGNLCKRGEEYALNECTHPVRTVTSTMRTLDGNMVAVKSSSQIPKEMIFAVMKEISLAKAPTRVKIGDVLIKNVANTGADIIASANV